MPLLSSVASASSGNEPDLAEFQGVGRALFHQTAVGVAVIDSASGRFRQVNQRYADIVGMSPEEMRATDFMSITHSADLEQDLAQMERLRAGEVGDFSIEKRFRRSDGAVVWVNLTVSPMWLPGQEPTTYIAIVEDITARMKAERMLAALNRLGPAFLSKGYDWDRTMEESLAELGPAAEASRAYVFSLHSNEAGVLHASQEHEWVAEGVTPEINNPELQNVPVVEGGYQRWIDRFQAGEGVRGQVHEFPESERAILEAQGIVSLMVVPILVRGEPWGFLGFDACEPGSAFSEAEFGVLKNASRTIGAAIEHGISEVELDARELELFAAQKMKAIGQLAGGVAHDFNNALTVILGNLGLAMSQIEEGHPARVYLEELDQAAERSCAVARQLLLVSRRQDVQVGEFDLHQELGEVIRLIRPLLGEDVELTIVPCCQLPLLHGDAGQIGQVFLNLCLNAREAMEEGGRIHVSTTCVTAPDEIADLCERAWLFAGVGRSVRKLDDVTMWVELSVADSGGGMNEEVLRDLFVPFFSTKDPSRGVGLGLAVAHGIIAKHAGLIEAESELGVGTTIRIFLPWRETPPVDQPDAR